MENITETPNEAEAKTSAPWGQVERLVMPVCTLCHAADGKFLLGENTPAQVGPVCLTCKNTILGHGLKAKTLKVVWSNGNHNWHHDFEITSPPVLSDVLVVHVSELSMDELLVADHTMPRCG